MMFGTGNGLAFVPLTAAALTDVEPEQAGAASGLVNVAQQVGGSLGLAILVTLGSSAAAGATRVGATAADVARHAFVAGADRAFLAASLFLATTVVLLALAIPGRPRGSRDVAVDEVAVPALAELTRPAGLDGPGASSARAVVVLRRRRTGPAAPGGAGRGRRPSAEPPPRPRCAAG